MASRFQSTDWYETPLYYDIVFDEDTQEEADFLEGAMGRFAQGRGRSVLEPACGSGRLVVELARRGHRVVGFDASEAMLDYARGRLKQRRLSAEVRHARLESFRFRERFRLAHCLVSTFKYLLTEKDARAHLEHVARALVPGGIYVLGMHLSDYTMTHRQRERWVGTRGNTRVVCNIQSWPPDRQSRRERVRSRLTVERQGETRQLETSWDFRTYDTAQLRRLLASVPALEHVATYDFGYDLEAPRELNDEQLDCLLILRRRRR